MSQERGLPGQPAGRWPSAPPAAGTTDQGRPKRPRETDAAVGLMMLQAVFGVATVLVLAVTGSLTQQSTANTPPGVSPELLHTIATAAAVVGVVAGVLGAAVTLLLALLIRQGRNAARIIAIIFSSLALVAFVVELVTAALPGTRWITPVVAGILDIALLVLLLRPPTATYCRDTVAWRNSGGV